MVVSGNVCPCCGRELDPSDPRFSLPLPDPVAELSEEQFRARVTARTEAIVAVNGVGGFIRVLLPVPLDDGRHVTFGVWVGGFSPAGFARIGEVWRSSDYRSLSFDALLANALPPWGDAVLRARCHVEARGPGQRPPLYVVGSTSEVLVEVLAGPWSAAEVLGGRGVGSSSTE